MAGCCLYGAFLMGLFLRRFEMFHSFRLSDPVLESDDAETRKVPARKALPGLDRCEEFRVIGMTCSSCANAVESSVAKCSGVKRGNVDVLQGRIQVVYDLSRTDSKQIRRAIEDAGFGMTTETGSASQQTLVHRLSQWNYGEAFTWSLFLLLPILGLEALPGEVILERRRQLYVLILAGFVQFGFGLPFHRRTWLTLSKLLSMSMDVLVSASTTSAYSASIVFFLQGRGTNYATMAASLISVLSLGKHLESRAKTSISHTLDAFRDSVPSEVRVVFPGASELLPVQMLRDGDLLSVNPGERFPCDGRLCRAPDMEYANIVEVDESFHTGEPLPVMRGVGDTCLAGTLNSGQLPALIEVQNAKEATARLEQTLTALLESQQYKSNMQTNVDKAMAYMVPTVLCLATASSLGWILFGSVDDALRSLIATLVVACPCALGLSTPTALMIAVATCSRYGIVLKRGAQAVEALASMTTVVFDKTGTITDGKMTVKRWHICGDLRQQLRCAELWWRLVYAAELEASHWAAAAIARHLESNDGVTFSGVAAAAKACQRECSTFVPGRGVACVVDETRVLVGNEQHLKSHGVSSVAIAKDTQSLQPGETCVLVAFNGEYAGMVALTDRIAHSAKDTVETLKAGGMDVYMMTGDRESAADEVARAAGIEVYWSGMTPPGKVSQLQALKMQGRTVGMVGDGVNDALALGSADVGVALHCGSPLAAASADLVLHASSIDRLPIAIEVAKAVSATVKANIGWAILYNALLLPLAMGVLRPFGLPLHPTVAGTLMMVSSLSIMYSSIRLEKRLLNIFTRQ